MSCLFMREAAFELKKKGVSKLKKMDRLTVAIILSVMSLLINICFNGKDILMNLRWILSCLS